VHSCVITGQATIMAFWRKTPGRGDTPPPAENPFRSVDPEAFDKGAKINQRAEELRRLAGVGLSESEAVIALGNAVGREIAAMIGRRPALSIEEVLDTVCDGAREQAELALGRPTNNEQATELSGDQFNDLANRIINTATLRTIPNDAISATAKALGVLVAFTARREGVSHDELLRFSQDAIAEFARDARTRLD
jgi:hypothetical protein